MFTQEAQYILDHLAAISNLIVETIIKIVLEWGNFEEQTSHTPPPSPPFKVGVFVFSIGSSKSRTTVTLHEGSGRGKAKCQRDSSRQSVETNFDADYLWIP